MALDGATRIKLLSAIDARNLIFLCGAGLSVSHPSRLMGAVSVAEHCYDRYVPIEVLPPPLRSDIDALASHFHAMGTFKTLFINALVPWDDLTGEPNAGHAAIGDFLLCGAATAAMSANFDVLIEQWCNQHKVAFRGALTGQEAVEFGGGSSPLLKFHGCMNRDRQNTLWTQPQLLEPDTQARIASCKSWMDLNLPNRHIVIVGFWTDWGYLNSVLDDALQLSSAASVTVIDPLPTADLETRAPALWATLTQAPDFTHVSASANDVLDELRTEYSKVWTRKFHGLGEPLYEAEKGPCAAALLEPPALTSEEFYVLRRDAEGVPDNRAARKHSPTADGAVTAFTHLLLLDAGAARKGANYKIGGRTVRIVHGAGEGLATVQDRFKSPPATDAPEYSHLSRVGESGSAGAPHHIRKRIECTTTCSGARLAVGDTGRGPCGVSDMSDLASNVHLVLREGKYSTWTEKAQDSVIGFEDEALMGFASIFETPESLLATWRDAEMRLLNMYAPRLRAAGEKAWNVYCVFLTAAKADDSQERLIRWIEENLERTRKLAAANVVTIGDVETALLALLPIAAKPVLNVETTSERLTRRIRVIAPAVADIALDDDVRATDVARRLGENW